MGSCLSPPRSASVSAGLSFTPIRSGRYTIRFLELIGRHMRMAVAAKKDVIEKVRQIISEQLGIDEADITPSASFTDDLKADSLDQVELIMALEEAFDLSIADEDAEKILKVQDAIDYVEKHAK